MRGGGLDKAEDTLQIDGDGRGPLLVGHGGDGLVVCGPDAVIDHQDIEIAESIEGGSDDGSSFGRGSEGLLKGATKRWAAEFGYEVVGLGGCRVVRKGDAGSCLAKQPDGGSADATRAAGDEGSASMQ